MLVPLLLLFILVPIAELALLIKVGTHIGTLNTVAMVLAIGAAGAWLARREGLRAITSIQREVAAGRMPGDSMIDGLLVLVAGILMITPGLLTDTAGLLLFIPPIRALVRNSIKKRFKSRMTIMHVGPGAPQKMDDGFIDVEAREGAEGAEDAEKN